MTPAGRKPKTLVVILGPTAVGKTTLAIDIARHLHTAIISCDSRQLYKEMKIGTAAPDREELAAVPHFFVHTIPVTRPYNCHTFQQEALETLRELFSTLDVVIATGGSMLYIDALCRGVDPMPDIPPETRSAVAELYAQQGLEPLRGLLRRLDPLFYQQVDLKNTRRVMHALEVCLTTRQPYSALRSGQPHPRDFNILKIGLRRDNAELRRLVRERVDRMIAAGLEAEARSLYPLRHLNALNTVGYKEWFDHFDGKISPEEAIRQIKTNTWRYARKQLSWFRRDPSIHWFSPSDPTRVTNFLRERLRPA